MKIAFFLALASLGLATNPAMATPLTVDGDLSDWGITVIDGGNTSAGGSNYSGLRTDLIGSMIEDSNDTAGDGGYLGPHYGGQNYDAEFMGWAVQGGQFHVAILTGQRPDSGVNRYSPGDLRIETSLGTFGIEVGGGVGGGAGTALHEGDAGSTYNLNSNGYTNTSNPLLATNAAQVAGSIWSGTDWINDAVTNTVPLQMKINSSSINHGLADYIYTRNDPNSAQHSVIEMSFNTSIFNGATIYGMYWLPSCGNDELKIEQHYSVPEPAPLALLGIGLLGLGLTRVRRRG